MGTPELTPTSPTAGEARSVQATPHPASLETAAVSTEWGRIYRAQRPLDDSERETFLNYGYRAPYEPRKSSDGILSCSRRAPFAKWLLSILVVGLIIWPWASKQIRSEGDRAATCLLGFFRNEGTCSTHIKDEVDISPLPGGKCECAPYQYLLPMLMAQ